MLIHKRFGNYRAKVIQNKDENKFGMIKVWIPDLMPNIIEDTNVIITDDETDISFIEDGGLWAYAANNPLGGRSGVEDEDQWGQGSCYIPKVGSYVWVFFEGGNINRPFYFGSLDIETSKVLPENQAGEEYQNKWTIFKSSQGRCIVISDDCDERIEITGKKRKLKKSKESPEGDIESVYEIDGNQTSILLEETDGNEKLLIKTHKGDYINIDITNQELHCKFKNNIYVKTDSDFYLEAKNIHMKADENMFLTADQENSIVGNTNVYMTAGETMNVYGKTEAMFSSPNTSVVGENLFLTGEAMIHQSTAMNLIGGQINIGLVIPRKAPAMPGREAGEAGEAGEPNPFGDRATNATCGSFTRPITDPTEGTEPIPSIESSKIPDVPIPPAPPYDGSLIPGNITADDIFEREKK